MFGSPTIYFTDAVLRAPTIGCMLMCLAAALVGVIVFLRKQSLIGEALSHASYPGVIIGVIIVGVLGINSDQELWVSLLAMTAAFASAVLGLWTINFLEKRMKVRSDSALCFVLSAFFGIGLTIASQVQFFYTTLYRKAQMYLYGQAATMTDVHIAIYGALAAIVCLAVIIFYKEIQAIAFDQSYARSLGINTRTIDSFIFLLIVLAVVIGIRSVGVVLMSAMLIAPAAAARQFTHKLGTMFLWAGFFGLLSGFLGNYLSVEIAQKWNAILTQGRVALPTGPMIVIVASTICLLALLFAPERGLILRLARIAHFRYKCMSENLLKTIWRSGPHQTMALEEIAKYQNVSTWYLWFVLQRLVHNGWIESKDNGFRLTVDGEAWAARIVRLHRLWEVYLAEYIGMGVERVHRSAEEMEHILTPELERELSSLLKNPRYDPHDQIIPSGEV